MGQINSAAYAMATNQAETSMLWHYMNVSKELTKPDLKGVVWDDVKGGNMSLFPLPADKRSYGELAGKYVDRKLYEALMEAPAPRVRSAIGEITGAFAQMFRVERITLNPHVYAKIWMLHFGYDAAAGLPPWSPRFAPRLTSAARAFVAYFDKSRIGEPVCNPAMTLLSGDATWVPKALEC